LESGCLKILFRPTKAVLHARTQRKSSVERLLTNLASWAWNLAKSGVCTEEDDEEVTVVEGVVVVVVVVEANTDEEPSGADAKVDEERGENEERTERGFSPLSLR
jgi:hypothetical protein